MPDPMKIISAPTPGPENPPPWPAGAVVREKATGCRYVLSRPLRRNDAYEFVCSLAHEDNDYSYMCSSFYCRCKS